MRQLLFFILSIARFCASLFIQCDTVYQDRIVWKERVVTRKVFVREAVASPVHQDTAVPVSVGRSLAAQPELLQFFTRAGEK